MQSRLSADELIAEAERLTGLSDWGEDDFRTPLGILVESAETEAALTPLGRDRLRVWLALRLEQRLKMIEDRKRRPGLATQAIDRPLVITGLPRAGTTYLHTLAGLHHAALTARFWQIYLPSPPPHAADCDVAA
ncbi:MAG TPA: sulfotransferase, partial [Novosphingobium sp.]